MALPLAPQQRYPRLALSPAARGLPWPGARRRVALLWPLPAPHGVACSPAVPAGWLATPCRAALALSSEALGLAASPRPPVPAAQGPGPLASAGATRCRARAAAGVEGAAALRTGRLLGGRTRPPVPARQVAGPPGYQQGCTSAGCP